MALHRNQARKFALLAKAASGVLAIAAIALIAVPMPFLSSAAASPAGASPAAGSVAEPPQPPPPKFELDIPVIGGGLWNIGYQSAPVAVAEEPVVEPEAPVDEEPVDTRPAVVGVRYLGSIVGPRNTHAMIAIGDAQHLLRQGQEASGIKLLSVARDHVMIERDGVESRVDLAAKVVDWATNEPAKQAPIPNTAQGRQPNGMTPDELRQKMQAERAGRNGQGQPRPSTPAGKAPAPAPTKPEESEEKEPGIRA